MHLVPVGRGILHKVTYWCINSSASFTVHFLSHFFLNNLNYILDEFSLVKSR